MKLFCSNKFIDKHWIIGLEIIQFSRNDFKFTMSKSTHNVVVLSINIQNKITEYNGNINDELAQEYKQKYRHQLHPPTPTPIFYCFSTYHILCDAIENWEGKFCTNFIHESKLNAWQSHLENAHIDISL